MSSIVSYKAPPEAAIQWDLEGTLYSFVLLLLLYFSYKRSL